MTITLQTLSLIVSAFVTYAALVGTFFAWRRLSTWNEQTKLKSKHEYAFARRLLLSIYQYRDTIALLRHPDVDMYIPSEEEEETPALSEEQKKFRAYVGLYRERHYRVNELWRDIRSDRLEAEILWDKEITTIIDKMFNLQSRLETALKRQFITLNPDASESDIKSAKGKQKETEKILYATLNDDDEFAKEFDTLVEQAEAYLKKKLKR